LTIKRACRTSKAGRRRPVADRLFIFTFNAVGSILIEIVRTNDLVMISLIESLLTQEGVPFFIADQHMSAVEGSLGFLPRRIMVESAQRERAWRLLQEAGLAAELRHE
jgi:Putative prokaryotic signal transducing protein